MLSIFLNIMYLVLPAIGIYGYYSDNYILLYIGAAITIFEIIIEICTDQLKSLYTIFLACILGIIITKDFLIGCCIGICFESIISAVFGLILLLVTFLASKKGE